MLAAPAALRLTPNLADNIERPLRYRPDGVDFVIENGAEFFNRPLYGGNTAFRSDAGDKPEFTLYLPGRGGNLRLGLRTAAGAKWLHEAVRIVTRYRPGAMLYEIRDPLLGADGVLRLHALALFQTDGIVVRLEAAGVPAGVELVWAYGGVNGQRGARDGDIGTERVPISEYFQLKPEFCRDNAFTLGADKFTLRAPLPRNESATIVGLVPPGATQVVADAAKWTSVAELFASAGGTPPTPVVTGRVALASGAPLFLALQRVADGATTAEELSTYRAVTADRPGVNRAAAPVTLRPAYRGDELPAVFAETDAHFAALRGQVVVDTPDPFLNAAVGALNVAVDAVWDEPQGAVMHGAIAWRSKLLGWRGPYAQDALGWHDRARRHFTYWAGRQNTDPIPEKLPPPDANANLSRSEAALHSNGDMSNSHYDMNLVYIDALFRHLLWTGDVGFARQVWPVIARHLAWERRLFRREFGPDKLPLYEAYAAIWASDDLQYSGGGTAHASAYNYWHNRMAARLARLLGADAAPYEREADLIAQGMRKYLWLADRGMFAESKDWLGLQLVHPSAALWTFYHTLDSEVPTPQEAWQMTRYVDTELPHLPVRGPGVPADLAVPATSNWIPYTWSLNNVVMGEINHTALGYWQAGRADEAFRLMKSALTASMFMGICPGNVGSMNYLDVYRRESQRDFADGGGVTARALVEGLFGVRPDALAGELRIAPGFPWEWTRARMAHPKVTLEYKRDLTTERVTVTPRFNKPMALRLRMRPFGGVARVKINGLEVAGVLHGGRHGRLEITSPPSDRFEATIVWQGGPPSVAAESAKSSPSIRPPRAGSNVPTPTAWQPLDLAATFNDRVTEIFRPGKYLSPRSPFCSLALPAQGIGAWAGHVNATAEIDDTGLRRAAAANGGRLVLPNGLPFATPGPGDTKNIVFTSQWDNYPREATVPLAGRARHVYLLMAGSTNAMQSRLDNGEVVVAYRDGTTARLALRNPDTWWPIEQDYFIDDYQFRVDAPLPPRVDLKTGQVRVLDLATFKGRGRDVPGGAATVLDLPLDPAKELQSLTVRALANDVVIGLMAATLAR
jgi:hypothetical protein